MKKHRKITAAVVAVIMCMSCTGFSNISNIRFNDNVIIANAEDEVWDGTDDTSWYDGEEKELYISTAEELAGLSTIVNKGNSMEGQTIVLGSDIYLNSLVDMDKWSENPPELTWTSIGLPGCPFKANFKGNGHTVHGLNGQSLFGCVESNIISELTLKNGYSGSICGHSENTTFENCINNNPFGSSYTITYGDDKEKGNYGGGICGWSENSIFVSCKNTGNGVVVSDINKYYKLDYDSLYSCIGGICGYSKGGSSFIYCENDGEMTGDNYTSGILGIGDSNFNNEIKFSHCVNNGIINGTIEYNSIVYHANGISYISYNDIISDCLNTGTVSGVYANGISNDGKIVQCCNQGDVLGIGFSCTDPGNSNFRTTASGLAKGIGGKKASYCSNYGNVISSAYNYGKIGSYGIGASDNYCCYNRGKVQSKYGKAVGIGTIASNCYNAGEMSIIDSGEAVIFGISDTSTPSDVTSCYYINTAASSGINSIKDPTIAKSAANMKKEAFVQSLGSAFVYVENDFPILFWEAGIPLLTIDKTDLTFSEYAQKETINAEVTSEDKIKWSSDDEKIATVDENGVVTAVGNGTCNIIAEVDSAKARCSVTVAYDYYIDPEEMYMKVDTAKFLKVYSRNTNEETDLEVSYSSSNEDVAEIDKRGIVSSNAPGVAKIHAFIGGIDLVCVVTVEGVRGDVNADGEFNIADVVALQKWLLAVPDAKLNNWKAGDLCEDDMLNVFDLCVMKKELVSK